MKTAVWKLVGTLLFAPAAIANAQFQYVTNSDGMSVTVTGYTGTLPATLAIPSTIRGLNVTDIGYSAFGGADELISVTIPPTVTSIGESAFGSDFALRSVTIPVSVTSIGEAAFANCDSLTNVPIPDSVVSIGYEAFFSSGLTSITIPGSVTNIAEEAVAGCGNLTNVIIGFGVPYIASGMFQASLSLTTVTIPISVTNIGDSAFAGCDLTQVYFLGNAPAVDPTVFDDIGRAPPPSEVDTNFYTATAYYLPGTTGWAEFMSNTFVAADPPSYPISIFVPAVLWNPVIQANGASFGVQSNQFGFDITGTTNIPIVIEASTNLAQPVWVPLQSMTLTNSLVHFSEPFQSNSPARFYRIGAP